MFKDSVRTTKETPHVTITKLMLFKEVISVYIKSRAEPVGTLCGRNRELLIVKAGGTFSYSFALKSYPEKWLPTSTLYVGLSIRGWGGIYSPPSTSSRPTVGSLKLLSIG
jgi:hypothetical protein